MNLQKRTTFICSMITVVSFAASLLLHYCCDSPDVDFWVDIGLGIFSGALLATLTAILSYLYERRQTMESFVYHTRQLLHYLSKYQQSMSVDEKLRFFLDYIEMDKSGWDFDYGKMDFMFEWITENRRYVYKNIYSPILQFNNAVAVHEWHFRWYLDGTGRNDKVMTEFISELEKYLVVHIEQDVPVSYDDEGNPTSFCKVKGTNPKLTREIREQLNGRYYEIMYGKRTAAKMNKEEN